MKAEIYKDNWERGLYKCSKCGNILFNSSDKFESGTKWPSFRKAMKGGVSMQPDTSLGMERTELICKKCGNHLGHIFDDGKTCGDVHPDAGNRLCILSSSLKFNKPKKAKYI